MLNKQISPWTIYDHSPYMAAEQSRVEKQKADFTKPAIPNRIVMKEELNRQARVNDLLTRIAKSKSKLNQKINIFTSLKIVRHHLFEESSPVSQILYLPKVKVSSDKPTIIKKAKAKHHFYSQLGIMNGGLGNALEDFSRVFVSVSLQPGPNRPTVAKPEFPKARKNRSILAELDGGKQLKDGWLVEVLEPGKQSGPKIPMPVVTRREPA